MEVNCFSVYTERFGCGQTTVKAFICVFEFQVKFKTQVAYPELGIVPNQISWNSVVWFYCRLQC